MTTRKSPNYWTKEKCRKEALKYKTRSIFQNNNGSAYNKARKNGWLNEVCSNMKSFRLPNAYWTKERCKDEAKKYKSRSEFQRNSAGAYDKARESGWLNEICSHMKLLQLPNGYWTKERCKDEAKKYKSRSEFQNNNGSAYDKARKNGWLNEICSYMKLLQLPRGYWTKEKCMNEAKKYKSRSEFDKKNATAYNKARVNGWLNEVCSHMKLLQLPNGYWTKEKCQEEAKKYKTRSEFQKNSSGAFNAARKNDWANEICSGMAQLQKPANYWTKEKCQEQASKYKTRTEFQEKSATAYNKALKEGWLNDICSKMISIKKTNDYWTKERCHEEGMKYNTRGEFQKNSGSAYNKAKKNGWLDEICCDMIRVGNRSNKLIYAYEFPNKFVYIGLTYNIEDRQHHREQDDNDAVTKHLRKTGLKPDIKLLTDYIHVDEAIKKEAEYIKKYQANGWTILNKSKAGSIGGNVIKWTKEELVKEALKYTSRVEFQKNNGRAYNAVRKKGWLKEICSHMPFLQIPNGSLTKEVCKKEASKYKTRTEFARNSAGAYDKSWKSGWLNDICSHMTSVQKPYNYWTKERCHEEALKYSTRGEFQKNSVSAYDKVLFNDWFDEMCSHMERVKLPNGYWKKNKEMCRNEALKYKKRSEFAKEKPGAYNVAKENNWLSEFYHI